jgi:hypothetical protein
MKQAKKENRRQERFSFQALLRRLDLGESLVIPAKFLNNMVAHFGKAFSYATMNIHFWGSVKK